MTQSANNRKGHDQIQLFRYSFDIHTTTSCPDSTNVAIFHSPNSSKQTKHCNMTAALVNFIWKGDQWTNFSYSVNIM